MLHPPERRLQLLLAGHAILSAVLACLYLASGDTGVLGALPNSFAKDALFVALSALGAADVRRRGWFALLIALAYLALVAGQVATLLWGGAPDVDVLGLHVSATVALLAWMAVDLVLAAWFAAWWVAAARARDGLRYLHPAGFAALQALADVTIEGDRELLSPAEVARNVDGYLADLDARGKGQVQLALLAVAAWPLLTLRPPLPALDHAARRALPRAPLHRPGGAPAAAAPAAAAAPGRRADRRADVLPRLLRRPPHVGVDRLHAVRCGARARRPRRRRCRRAWRRCRSRRPRATT